MSYGIFTYEQYDPEKHGSEDICAPVKDQYERRKDDPKLIKVVDWLVRKVRILYFSNLDLNILNFHSFIRGSRWKTKRASLEVVTRI